ncbi:MAG: hypothetical protein KDF60_12465 [Calditrichaeota bacterium]|nr:hypothetical protein [Calditrichota bacterium]
MAKKQTFGDKVKKGQGEQTKTVKVVYTYTSPKNGQMKFMESMITITANDNEDQVIENEIKNGRLLLEAKA